jgi:hypothetical protein
MIPSSRSSQLHRVSESLLALQVVIGGYFESGFRNELPSRRGHSFSHARPGPGKLVRCSLACVGSLLACRCESEHKAGGPATEGPVVHGTACWHCKWHRTITGPGRESPDGPRLPSAAKCAKSELPPSGIGKYCNPRCSPPSAWYATHFWDNQPRASLHVGRLLDPSRDLPVRSRA